MTIAAMFMFYAVILAAGLFFIRLGCRLSAGFWPSWSSTAKAMGLCVVAALPFGGVASIPAVAHSLGAVLALTAILMFICAWILGTMLKHPETGPVGLKRGGVVSLVWGVGGFVVVSIAGVAMTILISQTVQDGSASAPAKPPVDWSQYELVKPAPRNLKPYDGEVVPQETSQKAVDLGQERPGTTPPIAVTTQPASQNQIEAHYAEIYAAHPDADRIAESPSFAQWLRGRPNYQLVMQKGTAGQVIAVFSEFKAQRTNQQPLDLTYDPNWKSPSRP